MKLYLKNMVCNRCKLVVKQELENIGFHPISIELGEIDFAEELDDAQLATIDKKLEPLGFERIDNRKNRIVAQIKQELIKVVYQSEELPTIHLSDLLMQTLHFDYSYLSNLFSEVEGVTIEKFFIALKIERVKELLAYEEHTLSEIAYRMGYSSVAHLSSQFKKVTGLTPSSFKQLKDTTKRIPIDEVSKEP